MQKKENRFKKMKITKKRKEKKLKKKEKKRKTPQNCKSPTQRQRFITIIKNVTEGKKIKSLFRFHSANKIDSYNRGGKGEKKEKIQKNLQNKSKNKNIKYFS